MKTAESYDMDGHRRERKMKKKRETRKKKITRPCSRVSKLGQGPLEEAARLGRIIVDAAKQ